MDGAISRMAVSPELKEIAGTPQSNGSVETPWMPARPAMSLRKPYRLIVFEAVRLNVPPIACTERPARIFTVTGRLNVDPELVPERSGKTLLRAPSLRR